MIITQTPLRISFLGGGTDYPEHFRHHGGAVLATSINKYVYLTVQPLTRFFDYRIRISYSRTELCSHVDEIQHPSVRECLKFLGIEGGIEIHVMSDLPARTGLGSSSAFTVGLLHALHAFRGELVGREQLAAEAVLVERERIGERVGCQDQYVAAHGGLLHISFSPNDVVVTTPLVLSRERRQALESRLLIFYTGQQRTAHDILQEQLRRTREGKLTAELRDLQQLVAEGLRVLDSSRPLGEFGALLHEGWLLKRRFSQAVSNPLVDAAYEHARRAGAVGGKLLGAGGGGFLLLFVEPDQQSAVRAALAYLREVPFSFDNQGSRLVFYQP
ncbi:MAG: hypothetical protein NZ700_18350 [Gemmataceae bacterium]|nr:hypothetical protein [Gemmataceae bacterium]MDW8264928.1 hypothetical protein [Gemmataceae bacterium]